MTPARRLRVQHVLVHRAVEPAALPLSKVAQYAAGDAAQADPAYALKPILVWDDGDEMEPGPQLEPATVALSQIAAEMALIPAQLVALEQQLLAAAAEAAPKPSRAARRAKPKANPPA